MKAKIKTNPTCDHCTIWSARHKKIPQVMYPEWCMIDGKIVCCSDREKTAFGRVSFKCPDCGREKFLSHRHQS